MGILRVYLALCVVMAHSGKIFPWKMHDGSQAVQIFYIISGFYMAMVLSSRYQRARDFYISRLMRIYPPYFVALAGTILVSIVTGLIFRRWLFLTPYLSGPLAHNGMAGVLLVAISNFTLIGQDWVMFLSQDVGHPIHFTAKFWADTTPLWRYLLIPQCWSVGVELSFYALAPYLNRLRSRWLILTALGALSVRLFFYWRFGLSHDPWNYRFFPFEISLFLIGMLGYRFYVRTTAYHPSKQFRCASRHSYLIGAIPLLLLFYADVRIVDYTAHFVGTDVARQISYLFWALGIPILFFVFGNQKDDRTIGELSYPIYLVHFTVIAIITPVLTRLVAGHGTGLASAVISVFIAIIIYRGLIAPIDKKRHLLSQAHAPAIRKGEGAGAVAIL